MKRALKSSTIVPARLYVEREADRQLHAIIDEMGRPGYVLVARQMGKTNLLLNMKRQRKYDIVVYLDLSNRLDSARRWFRNVLDSIIEAYGSNFPIAVETILAQRSLDLEPNIEYDRHMRMILRESKQKIIVILDEIDSLINTSYSDVIFSQIRSMYFSRANFPEYEELTYVLSGVMEPSDLIKDKNISPFNIGEKIYLESFSYNEVQSFISQTGLDFEENTVRRVFEWVAGNPRMTWDLCAELELRYPNASEIKSHDVDDAVTRLYLNEFDRTPIDHIRTLAKSDPEIRDAIVSVRYGKSSFLAQDIKNKLYLAGITNTAGANATISNQVVDLALSDEWLETTPSRTIRSPGLEMFARGDYRGAIAQFEERRASNDDLFTSEEQVAIASSYLQLGKFFEAIREFRFCLNDKNLSQVKQDLYFRLGQALAHNGEFKEAKDILSKAQEGEDPLIRDKANLIEIKMIPEFSASLAEALDCCARIGNDNESLSGDSLSARENAAFAFFLQHKLYLDQGEKELAREQLARSERNATPLEMPSLKLATANLESGKSRVTVLRDMVNSLGEDFAGYPLGGDIGLNFGQHRMAGLFLMLAKANMSGEFQQLAKNFAANSFSPATSEISAIKHLYSEVVRNDSTDSTYIPVLVFATKHLTSDGLDEVELLEILREVVAKIADHGAASFARQYLHALGKRSPDQRNFFNHMHVDTLANIALLCHQDTTVRLERDLYDVWEMYREIETSFSVGHLYMDFFHLKGATLGNLNSRLPNIDLAHRLLNSIKVNETTITKGLGLGTLNLMKREAELTIQSELGRVQRSDPFRGIGRNARVIVQYEDNSLPVEKKFKFVSEDLSSGKCKFIRMVSSAKL